ncbi:hypothetical protein [Alienimonas californiensis]|uniref:hypothetical protein n=1 Tax=Alienimonas californiensis TaxID=2527989 RepID=UPI0011A3DE72|nr:hypothetical protein [Alienimonas californiensis]
MFSPLVALAAAACVAPLPSAAAGDGDIAKATRLAAAVEQHALAAARFGSSVPLPDYFAFAHTANAIAAEAHAVEVKLAVGDVAGAKNCLRHMKGLIESLDKQEDRLTRRGPARSARKAADDFADDIEDCFEDLEDEVEDLRAVPIVLHGGAPHPALIGRPTIVPGPVQVGPPAYLSPRSDSYRPAPSAPAWGGGRTAPGTLPPGFEYQGEGENGGVYIGPSRESFGPGAGPIAPAGGANSPGGLYGDQVAPRPVDGGSFRPVPSRDSYRPVPNAAPAPPRYEGTMDDGFDGPALPGMPQAGFDRSSRAARLFPVTMLR